MKPLRPFVRGLRRERGTALADELLRSCRALDPLPPSAHRRVKARVEDSLGQRPTRSSRWLQPIVVCIAMSTGGAAFGIALDRLVLKRSPTVERERGLDARVPAKRAGRPAKAVDVPAPVAEPLAPLPAPRATTATTELGGKADVAPVVAAAAPARAHSQSSVRKLAMSFPETRGIGASPTLDGTRLPLPAIAPAQPAPVPPAPAPRAPATPVYEPAVHSPTAPAASPSTLAPTPAPLVAAPLQPSEETLLARAVRALRAEQDTHAALLALDDYERAHPHGRFAAEAHILRVDALLKTERQDQALRLLDGLDMAGIPNAVLRRVQRGELRTAAHRWQDARADFSWVIANATGRESDLLERALWSRAQTWEQQGNRDQARRDAADYVRRFPNGRFVARAKALLSPGPDMPGTP